MDLRTQVLMGTYAHIRLPRANSSLAEQAFGEMKKVESILSTYQPDSEVSKLNRDGILVNPSPILTETLLISKKLYQTTYGYFDITLGHLTLNHYGFSRLNDHEAQELKAPSGKSIPAMGPSFVKIEADHIRITQKGLQLDFGGIGKGYAVDLAYRVLKSQGVRKGHVAISGDLRCFDSCLIEIENPLKPQSAMARFWTVHRDTSVSTSGFTYRYLGDHKSNHLLNPKTGQPQSGIASLTLVANKISNAELDGLTTALAVMPEDKRHEFLQSKEDLAYFIVYPDGRTKISGNFPQFVRDLTLLEVAKAERNSHQKHRNNSNSKPKKAASFK